MRILAICSVALGLCGILPAATFTVDTTDGTSVDVVSGDGVCATASGDCSLRAAVMESNALPGVDTIAFAIDGGGAVAQIFPPLPLPTLDEAVLIDGTTQGCPGDGPCIELMGTHQLFDGAGLKTAPSAGGTTIRGMAIGLYEIGIWLDVADGNVIENCHIGLNAAGTLPRGNVNGIRLRFSSGNMIGGLTADLGNRVAGNDVGLLILSGAGPDTQVLSNVFGGDSAIAESLFNGIGIAFTSNPGPVVIGKPGAGNVISGNETGIDLSGSNVSGVVIRSNCIGPIQGCSVPFGNVVRGVLINSAHGNVIGGSEPGEGNVIGGSFSGIVIQGQFAADNLVLGNFIGTDPSGTLDFGNSEVGIDIFGGAHDNTIGGAEPGQGNLIMNTQSTSGSQQLSGVQIIGANGNDILGNTIAFNGKHGVSIGSGAGNTIQGNAIADNGLLGIALANDEVTPNDPGDVDEGANDLQNFPVLDSASWDGELATVSGSLESTPGEVFELEFFSIEQCDPSNHGEGSVRLGGISLETASTGIAMFSAVFVTASIEAEFVTATATNSAGSTSEFSSCVAAGIADGSGACCVGEGRCRVTRATECSGVYQGDGTSCISGACSSDVPASSKLGLIAMVLLLLIGLGGFRYR